MEKLIELLNEYENTLEPNEQIEWTENGVKATPLTIISKQYGFIKWLLNNQEIDQEKLDYSLDSCSYIKNDLAGSCIKLTMFLSIQDKPIEFLVGILK